MTRFIYVQVPKIAIKGRGLIRRGLFDRKNSPREARLIVAVVIIRRTLFEAVYWLQSDGP